jgi:Trk K+ transport system NAD-binding subunit
MIALFSLLTIICISIAVIRIAAIALELTGLSREIAAFQAQSAFSGTGYTTAESEKIINHPLRRKIIRVLMMLGSAGLTSSIATLILTFTGESNQSMLVRLEVLLFGVGLIYLLSKSDFLYRQMRKLILKMLRRYSALRIMDFQEVFGLSKGYAVSRFQVKPDSWMANRTLRELKLNLEGILLFSIQRKVDKQDKIIGVPNGDTQIKTGDVLLCYGQAEAVKGLAERQKGDRGDQEHHSQIKEENMLAETRQEQGGYS